MNIVSLEIENFMSIGQAEISFGADNIISLCGYNDSGKSAVIRLLDIMLFNSYTRDQSKFIKDGESYFKGVLRFDDGVIYTYQKLANGVSIFTLSQGDKVLYTNKSGTSVISVSDIPEPIAKYLGVMKDECTDEKLNIRRCSDRLFLINTTGGDNYKILNTVLQSDLLSETTITLNTDKNRLMSEVTTGYNQISAIKDESANIVVSSDETLDSLEESLKIYSDKMDEMSLISLVENKQGIFEEIVVPPELNTISVDSYKDLMQIRGTIERSNIVIPPYLNEMRTDQLQGIRGLLDLSHRFDNIDSQVTPELPIIDHEQFILVSKIMNGYTRLNDIMSKGKAIMTELGKKRTQLHELCKQQGVTCCPECGAVFNEEGV